MMSIIGSFLGYLIQMLVLWGVIAAGIFIGSKLRIIGDAKGIHPHMPHRKKKKRGVS